MQLIIDNTIIIPIKSYYYDNLTPEIIHFEVVINNNQDLFEYDSLVGKSYSNFSIQDNNNLIAIPHITKITRLIITRQEDTNEPTIVLSCG